GSKYSNSVLIVSPASPRFCSSRNRRNDGKRVASRSRRALFVGKISHVLIIEIQVHKGAHLAFSRKEMLSQFRMRLHKRIKSLGNRGGRHLHFVFTAGECAQGGWNIDGHSGSALFVVCL